MKAKPEPETLPATDRFDDACSRTTGFVNVLNGLAEAKMETATRNTEFWDGLRIMTDAILEDLETMRQCDTEHCNELFDLENRRRPGKKWEGHKDRRAALKAVRR